MKRVTNLLIILICFILFLTSIGCKRSPKERVSSSNLDLTPLTDKYTPTGNKETKNQRKEVEIPGEIIEKIKTSVPGYNKEDLRKFPYPYSSLLAICSDIDNTTEEEFEEYHRFLNTKEYTVHGRGLGLDVGDSMWMYTSNNTGEVADNKGGGIDKIFTYYMGTDSSKRKHGDRMKYYYEKGWIDALHTVGDFSRANVSDVTFKRQQAVDAFKELNRQNMKFKVWINHGNEGNRQNFGASNMGTFYKYQSGDDPKSPFYVSDLVVENGIKYIWNSVGETEFGRDNPLYPLKLRDGKNVWGFHRYTHDMVNGKLDWTWHPASINKQLTRQRLDSIVQNKQYSIVTQHLGVDTNELFQDRNVQALRLLQEYKDNGKILVARTSKLLDYALCQNYVRYSVIKEADSTWINISSIADPVFGDSKPNLEDVRGITFFTDNPDTTYILIDKKLVPSMFIERNPGDESSKKSISIKWYDENFEDYTKDE